MAEVRLNSGLYISSLDSSAERLSQITKQHWAIESMHWDP